MAITNTILTAINGSSFVTQISFYANANYIGNSSNFVVNANGTVSSNSNTLIAPEICTENYFVPVAGKRYKITYTLRKTSPYDPTVTSYLKPGFYNYANSSDVGYHIKPTFGQGLDENGLVDTSLWVVGKDYKIGAIYSWDEPVPERVFPRLRINRNATDTPPYSNATFLVSKVSFDPEIKFSELEGEYTGNTVPVSLSLLHRKVQLTRGDAYIVDTEDDYNLIANTLANVIVSQADIFNTWNRFGNGGVLYSNFAAIPITDQARSWVYNSNTDQVISNVNSTYPIGFISPSSYFTYTHSAIVSSTNSDDDAIGLVVGSISNAGIVRNLVAWRSQGGNGPIWGLVDKGPATTILINRSNTIGEYHVNVPNTVANSTNQGWLSYGNSIIRVEKTENSIKAWTSQKGNTTIDANTIIEYTIPDGGIFAGVSPYGYFASSQNAATFSNIAFTGGLGDFIFDHTDPDNKKVFENVNNVWTYNASLTTETILGAPRIISNPLTGKVFSIDGSGLVEDTAKNKAVPITGKLSLSNFYGTEDSVPPVFVTPSGSLGSVVHANAISIQINVTDHSNDVLHFTLVGAPIGFSISSSGLLNGSIASAGTYNFTVYAFNVNKVANCAYSLTVT